MPSSPDYKRDYKQEKKTSDARGEKPKRAARNRARLIMEKAGMVRKGQDVDHKKPLAKGGAATSRSNLRAVPASENRSFPRNRDGSIKSNL